MQQLQTRALDFCNRFDVGRRSAVEFDEHRFQSGIAQRACGTANDLRLDTVNVDLDVGGERRWLELEKRVERKRDAALLKRCNEGALLPVQRRPEVVQRLA